MSGLLFTPWHEWVRINDGIAAVGLSGVGMTGDVVYIELPEIGRIVMKGEACAKVETTKTVCEVHSPFAGSIIAINDTVFDEPDTVGRKPLDTWLFKMKVHDTDTQELLTEQEYAELKQVK